MPKVPVGHGDRRRGLILEGALRCFSRKGYHETTVDEIASEVMKSKGLIYKYFKSKDNLFLALQEQVLARMMVGFIASYQPEDTARLKLEKGAEYFFSTLKEEYADFCRISLEFSAEAVKKEELRQRLAATYREWQGFLQKIIQEGINRGEFRADLDPLALATVILATSDGVTLQWIHGVIDDPQAVRAAMVSALADGMTRR